MLAEPERCYAAALRILRHRFNSAAELRLKLRAKRFDKDVIDQTLARLAEERWLDDARFAGAYVRTRQARGVGTKRIARELTAAGVDAEEVRNAVAENADQARERENLELLCQKRLRVLIRRHGAEYAQSSEGRKKLAAYLLKQGYDAALVSGVVKESSVVHD